MLQLTRMPGGRHLQAQKVGQADTQSRLKRGVARAWLQVSLSLASRQMPDGMYD